jgi:6-pyruvoyltetrahydropterin/6-carboxytetrahydropterin synthase
MYELMVRDSFAAAHSLRHYRGKCERVHGHNYAIEAFFTADKLEKNGLAVDFTILKKHLKLVIDDLDHRNLNEDIPFFRKNNTSAENVARYIYDRLKLKAKKARVSKVCVYESDSSMASYYE